MVGCSAPDLDVETECVSSGLAQPMANARVVLTIWPVQPDLVLAAHVDHDRMAEDVFDIQDEITQNVVAATQMHIDLTEAYDSIQKIREIADILLPLHDLSIGRMKSIP